LAKTVLKKAHQEAVVKVAGTAASATISLASDLLHTNQVLIAGGTPTVNIVGAPLDWCCQLNNYRSS
jgi:hypothetical protein